MGFLDGLSRRPLANAAQRSSGSAADDVFWSGALFSSPTVSGVHINQTTALNATALLAAVTILSEDFAKLTPSIMRGDPRGGVRTVAKDHYLYDLLYAPNDWQNWFEFAEMLMISLCLRGNGYAVIIRNGYGDPVALIPVNADWVGLWEAQDGKIFYRVTPIGLHMMAELSGEPFFIPAEDMFHVRGFSLGGLLGASKIVLAKEAIGLALAYEQQATRWMGNSASLSGVLQTDQRLTKEAAERLAADWKERKSGIQNVGKIAVLEQGLKYQPISMTAEQAEFINSRQFQIAEISRIFRIPPHMIGDLARSTNNNISQQAQEYINLTLSSYVKRWQWKLDTTFDLRRSGLFVDFDLSQLIRADITTRYANYARGISGGFLMQNEARADDGRDPVDGGDVLLSPMNLSAAGSNVTGAGAEGGHPTDVEAGEGPTTK